MSRQSAIPDFYYVVFALYEPALCLMGFVGALVDPKGVGILFPSLRRTS
jgi:hypothetical protein